jgi:Glutathione S-transferase, C-terminal domain
MKTAIPHMRDQLRAHLDWIEAQLGDGRQWLLGEFSLADISTYMNVWFLRLSLPDIDKMLANLPLTLAWEERVRAIGHGSRSEMSSAEALDIATRAAPQSPTFGDSHDPNGRQPGDRVSVMPDDYGKVEVHGEIVSLSAQHIAIRRHDDQSGETVVHFPRAGFLVTPL